MTRPASTLDDIALLSGLTADARDVYFIASGSVRVVNWSYSGREVSFEDVPAGGTTFGELAAIGGAPRSAPWSRLRRPKSAASIRTSSCR